MTRQIKFRGKDIQTGEWRYGFIEIWPDGDSIIVDMNGGAGPTFRPSFYSVAIGSVGEYIGVKDVNGKEIYEGDIVIYTMTIAGQSSEASDIASIKHCFQQSFISNIRVAGNVYDNPELIKGGISHDERRDH